MYRLAFFILIFCLSPGFAQKPPEMVKAQLVSERGQVVAGQAFTVGLHLVHKKGWHTYWENPGDVGIPPTFNWKLPTGWHVGKVQYQAPQTVKMFDITAHGFSGTEALHLVELTPPQTFTGNPTNILIKADVTWMLCGRSCHPGTFPFALRLPIGERSVSNTTWTAAFDQVRRDHPRSSSAWTATAKKTADSIILELHPIATAKETAAKTAFDDKLYYFGLDKQVFSNRAHKIEIHGDAEEPNRRIRFTLPRADYGPSDKTDLEAVLHAKKGWLKDGELRYLHVHVPFQD